jgi:hypothetical protein
MTIGNTYAWDEEGGYEEGEYVNLESGIDEYGNRWVNYNPDNPNWYDSIFKLVYKIIGFFKSDTDITIEVETTCEKWDGDSYEEDDTRAMFSDTLTHNANNTIVTVVSNDPEEEYFKNNTDAIDTFTTIEDDPDHPDLLNVSVTISGGGVDYQENGYTAITDEGLDGINERITNPDYGFNLDGRGSGGGSGSIYKGIDMYGASGKDTTGMGTSFNTIFWCIIPLIFILAVMKLSSRVMK